MFRPAKIRLLAIVFLVAAIAGPPVFGESGVRVNLELYNTVYRGLDGNWYYTGTGKADTRFESIGNKNMRAQVAVEFYPVDVTGGSPIAGTPIIDLKRMWFKASFPNWRLTAGKTKLAWGNGFVFNAGDVIFGSLGPFLDFTQSTIRDDTSWLTAFNVPTGRFSFIEAVVLPPNFVVDSGGNISIQPAQRTSAGARFFARTGTGWRLEFGYLYKGDEKVNVDLLGHRPYFSFHGHAGVDWYGGISLAAGWDPAAGINRDTWDEVSRTVNMSLGLYHQLQTGYDSTLTLRFETIIMPWQNWEPVNYQDLIDGMAGNYGIYLYPEITWMLRSTWYAGLQSIISPVDSSAQITTTFGWHVFQGFTLLGFIVVNTGAPTDLFAFDRSSAWPNYPGTSTMLEGYEFNGINFTLGARYSF